MIGLSFSQLSKRFLVKGREVPALEQLNLQVRPGERIALLGPSGCGKSTLLNILAGLEPAEGRLDFSQPPHIGYVFQEARLLPWLTLEQNLLLVQPRPDRGIVWDWLQRVGLAGYANYFPQQLSIGMQQRAAVARALLIRPNLVLLDEPFSSLDELTAQHMRQELVGWLGAVPATVILVTHNPLEAVYLADRVVLLSKAPGRICCVKEVPFPQPRTYEDPALWIFSRHLVRLLEAS